MSTLRSLLFVALLLTSIANTLALAQTESVLFSFSNSGTGQYPWSTVIVDGQGNLFGTTLEGGAHGFGTVFELSLASGHWTETILHDFNNDGRDGVSPYGGLIFDSQGNIYGTTYYGGTGSCSGGQYPGCGTVFELNPSSHTYQIIHNFSAGSDGAFPASTLILDSKGTIYGTTASGGNGACNSGGYVGCGTVFGMAETNGKWREEVLYSFSGASDGEFPYGPVTLNAAALYGTTEGGLGTVFKLQHSNGRWLQKTIYSFNGSDGANPVGNLLVDGQGSVYGTTMEGGASNLGSVFKVSKEGLETVLHSFSGPPDGEEPESGLTTLDAMGNAYGTTAYGGDPNCNPAAGCGTVFKITKTGQVTVLHSFTGIPDGFAPNAGVVGDPFGNLYGTTSYGGDASGTVFELTP